MIKKLMLIFALVALFGSITNAQWTNEGIWPDSTNFATHGIAVDPDGKVWFSNHFTHDSWATPDNDIIPRLTFYYKFK